MIDVTNLRKTFRKRAPYRGFELFIESLRIADGEILYFLGPNGSGKTTLLALFQGLLAADEGSINSTTNVRSGWFSMTAWLMCCSKTVLPVRGGATINAR